jgi:hypothetical protein
MFFPHLRRHSHGSARMRPASTPAGPALVWTQARVHTDIVLPCTNAVKTRPQVKLRLGGKNRRSRASGWWKRTNGWNGRSDGHFNPKTSVMTTLCDMPLWDNIEIIAPIKVRFFLLLIPFCCGVSEVVYWRVIPWVWQN